MSHNSEMTAKAREDLRPEIRWLNNGAAARTLTFSLSTNAAHKLARILREEQDRETVAHRKALQRSFMEAEA